MPSSSQQVWCRFGAVSVKFLARTESCQSLSIPAPLARVPGRRSQTPWIKSRGRGDAALDLKSRSQAGRCVPVPRHWFTSQCLRLQHQLGRTPGPATCEQSFWRLVGTSQQLETRRSLFLQLFRPSFVFCLCVCLLFFFFLPCSQSWKPTPADGIPGMWGTVTSSSSQCWDQSLQMLMRILHCAYTACTQLPPLVCRAQIQISLSHYSSFCLINNLWLSCKLVVTCAALHR